MRNVRYASNTGELMRHNKTSRGANRDLMRRSKQHCYSITSSGRTSSEVGIVMPSAFAAF
jgi:hypothetical protein